jgi:hypothetical protein
LVALLVVGIAMARGGAFEPAYLSATNVLFWWYVAWSVPIGIVALLLFIGFTAGGALTGLALGRGAGALAGLGAGGVAGFYFTLMIFVRRGLFINGASVLGTALTVQGPEAGYLWNRERLIIGAVLIGLPILLGLISRGSSSPTPALERSK